MHTASYLNALFIFLFDLYFSYFSIKSILPIVHNRQVSFFSYFPCFVISLFHNYVWCQEKECAIDRNERFYRLKIANIWHWNKTDIYGKK